MKSLKLKLIAIITLFIFITQMSITTYAATKKELQNQQSDLNTKIEEAEDAIEDIKTEKSAAMKEVQNIISEISEYEDEIDELNDKITNLNVEIKNTEKSLNEAQEEYQTQEKLLNERLVLMYEDGETSYLDFILSSEGLADFISNYYLISELASYDNDLLDQIEAKRKSIEEQKAKLESSKNELNTAKASKQKKQTELKGAKSTKETYVAKLTAEEKAEKDLLEQYEADKKAITQELKKIAEEEAARARAAAAANKKNIVTPSSPSAYGYIFPVQGCSKANINNKSYPSYRGHTGVDVNIGVTGKNVVAVKAGTVVKSMAYIRGGSYYSYGECIVISHGDGTMTLYAHLLAGSRRVAEGQQVSQGQVIGIVGSTGNSTGPHVHFEVREDGVAVDPKKYLNN